MKRNIIRKCILILAACALLVYAAGKLISMYIEREMSLSTTVIAVHDLAPRTLITEDDLQVVEIPSAYLLEDTCCSKEEAVGRYTDIQGRIPAGSPVYTSMIHDSEELPDHPELQLRGDQAVYTMEAAGNDAMVLTAGQRVDIHVSVERHDASPLTGCVIAHARILSLKDHQGLEVTDPESTGMPYLLSLAVSKEDIDLLSLAETVGTIRLFAGSESYDTDLEAILQKDTPVTQYLLAMQAEGSLQTAEEENS